MMQTLGCLGLVLSIALVVGGMILVLGTDLAIPLLEPIFCPENDTLIRTTSPAYDGGENINYYCVDDDGGGRTSADGQLFLAIAAMWLPLGLSILLLIVGATRRGNRSVQSTFQTYPSPIEGTRVSLHSHMPDVDQSKVLEEMLGPYMSKAQHMGSDQQLTLKEKLLQLRDAYDAGLITGEELEQRKQAILDDLVE